jgi:voltage-gated potassium channel
MWRRRIHEALDVQHAHDPLGRVVQPALAAMVLANVALAIAETVPGVAQRLPAPLRWFELFSMGVFAIEYALRLWTSAELTPFARPWTGRLRYALTPLMLVDLAVLLLPAWLDLRPLRILRLFRLVRYSKRLMLLLRVVRDRAEELLVAMAMAAILLIIASTAMYWVEHRANPGFDSIPATMWWGVATLTTVGYGDVTPITPLGKVLGGFVALLGVGLFALPAGILAGGFAEELQRLRKERQAGHAGHVPRCPHCGSPL